MHIFIKINSCLQKEVKDMNLLIVESPSKAKTIEKYLGTGWRVIASVGHVRDLVPENGSVDTENKFKMKWQIMPGK